MAKMESSPENAVGSWFGARWQADLTIHEWKSQSRTQKQDREKWKWWAEGIRVNTMKN